MRSCLYEEHPRQPEASPRRLNSRNGWMHQWMHHTGANWPGPGKLLLVAGPTGVQLPWAIANGETYNGMSMLTTRPPRPATLASAATHAYARIHKRPQPRDQHQRHATCSHRGDQRHRRRNSIRGHYTTRAITASNATTRTSRPWSRCSPRPASRSSTGTGHHCGTQGTSSKRRSPVRRTRSWRTWRSCARPPTPTRSQNRQVGTRPCGRTVNTRQGRAQG